MLFTRIYVTLLFLYDSIIKYMLNTFLYAKYLIICEILIYMRFAKLYDLCINLYAMRTIFDYTIITSLELI